MLSVSVAACHHSRGPSANVVALPTVSPTPFPAVDPVQTVDSFLTTTFDPLYDWERKAYLAQWRKVQGHENFDLIEQVDGEVAGAYGLALIVNDRRITNFQRSSLIVFIARPHNRSDLYWIFKQEDLSRAHISRLSGDIMVDGFREDGSPVNCEIAWKRQENKWTCMAF